MILFFLIVAIDQNIKIADSLFTVNQYHTAESIYVDLLSSPNRQNVAYAYKGIANIRLNYGAVDSALYFYEKALMIFNDLQDLRGQIKILNNLGAAANMVRDHDRALDFSLKGIKKSLKLKDLSDDDTKDMIALYNNAGYSYEIAGANDQAVNFFADALAMSQKIGYKAGTAEALYNLATLYQNTGQIKMALDHYYQAQKDFISAGIRQGTADCWREIGNIQRRLGNYQQAISHYNSALVIFEDLRSEQGFLYGHAEIINNLGLLNLDMNQYTKAKEFFYRVYDIYSQEMNVDIDGLATAMINLGTTYGRLAQTDALYYDSSFYFFEIAQKYAKEKSIRAGLFYSFGLIHEQKGEYENAEKHFDQALKNYVSLNDKISIAKIQNDMANIRVKQRNFKDALDRYHEALATIDTTGNTTWQALLKINLGITLKKMEQDDSALTIMGQAADLIENIRGQILTQEYRSTYFTDKSILYEEIIDLYFKKDDIIEAFNYIERAKARNLLDLVGQVDFSERSEIPQNVQNLIAAEREKELLVDYLTGDPRQAQAIIDHNKILTELAEIYPEYAAIKSVSPVNLDELQSMIDDSTALIEFFTGHKHGFVMAITNQGICGQKLAATSMAINNLVDTLIRLVKKKGSFQDQSALIFDQLIKPIYKEIESRPRIGIIPHSFLHHLPFALLFDRNKAQMLIQSHDIFYLPSASIFSIAHRKNPLKKEKAAIFAKSEFHEHPDWLDLPLPGTNAEKDSLIAGRIFKMAEVFSDIDSTTRPPTETNAKKYMNEFDIVHLATHGKLDPDTPLDSRILLSADKNDDGILKTREIFNLPLKAYLITLSACETGKLRGFDGCYAGDELTGLTRAFIFAGAASVVASLWKVHDQATALLMMQFYRNLQQYDKTRALNQAQRWMMENDDIYYFNPPYYWAAFAVFGDWQ